MEKKNKKVIVKNPGGNASKEALAYTVSLPSDWAKKMKITPEDRNIKMTFDGEKIIITR